ncbi:hypothetical protein ABZ814_05785 [Micromonospora musae]|uniref:hypothetical protein n=1 Tax=Micromonospora musae TaxID=1894970 RepID=UPI0033DCDC10
MRHVPRVLAAILLGLVTLGTTQVVTAGPSQAAVSCSGTVTYARQIPSSNPIGELVIYYNSTNGGTNSACFNHRGASYGVSATTAVSIVRCAERSGEGQACTPTAGPVTDAGNYAYYAGPVGVTGTANYCVAAAGNITWKGTFYSLSSGRQGCPNP